MLQELNGEFINQLLITTNYAVENICIDEIMIRTKLTYRISSSIWKIFGLHNLKNDFTVHY